MSGIQDPLQTATDRSANNRQARVQRDDMNHMQPHLTLPGGRDVNPWLVLLSIMLGFFMSLLDATITNIALTSIQTSLKTDLTTVSWVINAYLIAFAGLLVTMGRFADQFGRKRVFMLGMVIFSLGSLLCALAPTIEWLIFFRVLQGVGAAALNSVSLAIITGVFPPEKRGAAVGIWGALAGLAAAVGPVLGGLLLSLAVIHLGNVQIDSWRWVFFINIPFCVAGLVLIARNVPEMRDPNATRNIDWAGLLTLSVGMVCLSLALIQGNDWKWDGRILGLFVSAVAAFALFAVAEVRQQHPLLDFRLFRIRSFSAANIVMFLFGIAAQGAFLLVVLYFINGQGYSQLGAAYAFLPMPLAAFVISALVSPLSRKISPKYLAIVGMAIFGLGFLSFTTVTIDSGPLDTAWRAIILGIGLGLCYSSLPAMVLAEVPHSKLGVASGAFNTFRQFGFVIGVALLISVFSGQSAHKTDLARNAAIQDVQQAINVPATLKTRIIHELQQPGTNGSSTNIDGQQVGTTPLSQQVSREFKKAVIDSFIVCWFVSASIALFGILPALFTSTPRIPIRSKEEEGVATAAV
jgi:EmrB/QacA subfamily drug resistance transporter